MLPVEPRPVVIGTIEAPSRNSVGAGLRFFPKMPAAFSPEGANQLLAAPIAARNERRLQPNFIANLLSADPPYYYYLSAAGVGGFTTLVLPTISIRESPGIHSTAMHAREGALPGEK